MSRAGNGTAWRNRRIHPIGMTTAPAAPVTIGSPGTTEGRRMVLLDNDDRI